MTCGGDSLAFSLLCQAALPRKPARKTGGGVSLAISRFMSQAHQHHSLDPDVPRLTLLGSISHSSRRAALQHSAQLQPKGATSSTPSKAFRGTTSSSPPPFSGYQDVQLTALQATQPLSPIVALPGDTARLHHPGQRTHNFTVLLAIDFAGIAALRSVQLHTASNRRRHNLHPIPAIPTDSLESSATFSGNQLKAHAVKL